MKRPMAMTQPKTRRTGMTLIEVATAMAIGVVLLGLAVTMLARVIAANATAGEHLEGIVVLDRLGEQFRRDVHASASAKVGNGAAAPERISLTACDGSQVEYEIASSGLRRTKNAPGQPPSREVFVLPGMKVLPWKENTDANGEVSLWIGRVAHRTGDDETINGQFAIRAFIAGDCAEPKSP
jgi:prepilin-type N-terminal cleavage/methylation domain-containing protein